MKVLGIMGSPRVGGNSENFRLQRLQEMQRNWHLRD